MNQTFTQAQFMKFYGTDPNAVACYDAISGALTALGINTPLALIGALGTCRVEVGRAFKPIPEYADGSAYEGRIDLWNYIAGDGIKYKGNGLIQITGYKNYALYGHLIGVDLINHPELALDINNASKILAWYFKLNNIPYYCNQKDWITVRKLVNGGNNNLPLFLSVVGQYLTA